MHPPAFYNFLSQWQTSEAFIVILNCLQIDRKLVKQTVMTNTKMEVVLHTWFYLTYLLLHIC
jgi:hypothetical protein